MTQQNMNVSIENTSNFVNDNYSNTNNMEVLNDNNNNNNISIDDKHVGLEYYKSLKQSMCDNKKVQHVLTVENAKDIIKSLDNDPNNENLRASVVVGYLVLNSTFKSKLLNIRKRNMKFVANAIRESSNNVDVKSENESQSNNENNNNSDNNNDAHKSQKINKETCLSDYFGLCTSKAMKIATVLFLATKFSDSFKRDFILAILNNPDNEESVIEIMDLCKVTDVSRKSIANIRSYIDKYGTKSTGEHRKALISALIEISEILNDRACCKLAMEISYTGYISLCKLYLQKDYLHHIVAFTPIVERFIKEFVIKKDQEQERSKIHNQCKVNIKSTITDLINALPSTITNKVSATTTKACILKPDQVYQYYKGVPNYSREIITTYHHYQNRRYQILTYCDCLFDVLGYAIKVNENDNDSLPLYDYVMFDTISWSERLKLIDFRTKIAIEDASGEELNKFINDGNSTSDLTVSWLEDNTVYCMKTIEVRKNRKHK